MRYVEKAVFQREFGQLKLAFEALQERKRLLVNAPFLTSLALLSMVGDSVLLIGIESLCLHRRKSGFGGISIPAAGRIQATLSNTRRSESRWIQSQRIGELIAENRHCFAQCRCSCHSSRILFGRFCGHDCAQNKGRRHDPSLSSLLRG